MASDTWELTPWVWRHKTLHSHYLAGEYFSIHLFWDAHLRPAYWYVNFEQPFRRTAIGIDTLDLFVDLVITPDLSSYTWKDEAEYAQARRLGLVDDATHSNIEQARDRALCQLKSRTGPFAESWPIHWLSRELPLPDLPQSAITTITEVQAESATEACNCG